LIHSGAICHHTAPSKTQAKLRATTELNQTVSGDIKQILLQCAKRHNEIAVHRQSNVAVIAEVITFASLLPLSRAQQYEREDH